MKIQTLVNTSINFLKFLISGQLKIFSSQGIRNSLYVKYLKRLPVIGNRDIALCINNTYLIFHEDAGLTICNKYGVISSEMFLWDHREGYCEPVELIEPFTESDKEFQPVVIKDKFFTLN